MEKYIRNCPDCNKELSYCCKRYLERAINNKSVCNKCKKMPSGWKEKMIKSLTGRKNPNYKRDKSKPLIFFRNCPDCGNQIGYRAEKHFKHAIKKKTLCNSCTCEKYKKYKHFQSPKKIQKMAATKAGYDSYEEYMNNITEKIKYRCKVWSITRKQPVHTLENFDKRGKCGVAGAYQLDHKISIFKGFNENISPEKIGNISNIQFITWQQNLSKSNN